MEALDQNLLSLCPEVVSNSNLNSLFWTHVAQLVYRRVLPQSYPSLCLLHLPAASPSIVFQYILSCFASKVHVLAVVQPPPPLGTWGANCLRQSCIPQPHKKDV